MSGKRKTLTRTFEAKLLAHCQRGHWTAYWEPNMPDPHELFPELVSGDPREGARVLVTLTMKLISKGHTRKNPWAEPQRASQRSARAAGKKGRGK